MSRRHGVAHASFAALGAASLLLVGCLREAPNGIDERAVLRALGENVALATLRELDARALDLSAAAAGLAAEPDAASLDATQEAWRASRAPWRELDVWRFGPVVTLDLEGAIDWWPAKAATIEAVVAGEEPIDAQSAAKLGASAKGSMALEYLLFDPGADDATTLAALTGQGGLRRRTLVAALAANLARDVAELRAAWEPGGGGFATAFESEGRTDAAPVAPKAAIDELVNQMVSASETVADARIGKPFGKKSAGVVQPDLEGAPRSDNSLADIASTLRGIAAVYAGDRAALDGAADRAPTNGLGVGDLVEARSPATHARVKAALEAANASVAAIPPPLRTALDAYPADVEAAWRSVKALRTTLGTEVVSALGTTVRFDANDGD